VWYCFLTNGEMVKNGWMQDAGKWFYLGNDGRMVKNAMIDNQYYVGADGVWVQ
jgi:FOG: Glucan-binding domain (YG repeat)